MNMMDIKPPVTFDFLTKGVFCVASVDIETMRQCPEKDWSTARSVGLLMLFTWCYQTAIFVMITTRLFGTAGQTRPELVVVSVFIATFILLIDRLMVIHSGWHLSGIDELCRCGGLDISGGVKNRIKSAAFFVIRLVLSVGIAQLTAIFLSLLIFGADIDARIRNAYLYANAALTALVTTSVDTDIQRAKKTLEIEDTRYSAMAAQASAVRQNQIDPAANDPLVQQASQEIAQLMAQKARDDDEVRRSERFASDEAAGIKNAAGNSGQAGNGPRRRAALEQVAAARAHVQATDRALEAARGRLDTLRGRTVAAGETAKLKAADQTPEFERALGSENAERARLQEQLTALEQGRNEKIRQAVMNAPGYVAPEAGFLTQIRLLGQIADSDPKLRLVILLIELTSFGFELASVLGKATSFSPTVYSAVLARDVYMSINGIVDGMMARLDRTSPTAPVDPLFGNMANAAPQAPAAGNGIGTGAGSDPHKGTPDSSDPVKPAKRPRGRPRKTVVH